jgi:hypothetical protein
VFTTSERSALCAALAERATHDRRVEAAALVGSLAVDAADRYSDIDLALGIAADTDPMAVLADWSAWLSGEAHATTLLDWPVPPAVYRVFLLPSCLQVDLSVVPSADFTRRSPRFRLLFGTHRTADVVPPDPADVFAYGVLYAIEARRDIERGRVWQAQHFLNQYGTTP